MDFVPGLVRKVGWKIMYNSDPRVAKAAHGIKVTAEGDRKSTCKKVHQTKEQERHRAQAVGSWGPWSEGTF